MCRARRCSTPAAPRRPDIDLVVSIGGDGTLLFVASMFRRECPPVLPVHEGSLGFLTQFSSEAAIEHLDRSLRGDYFVALRMRLVCKVVRADGSAGRSIPVLNEVVVSRGSNQLLANLDCYCNNKLITKVQADGLILSSAVGSTAYSMSAGGALVHPTIPAILFTPICPHSLSLRPLILPETVEVKVTVPKDARASAWAAFDGHNATEINLGDSLLVKSSQFPVPMITQDKGDAAKWFSKLAVLLGWNQRTEQGRSTRREDAASNIE
jgi:NAD+ kinase